MNKKPTPKSALHFWGVSQIGYQLMQNMDTTFFSYFLTDVALFSVTLSGTVLTATSVVDLIYSIIVGAVVGMLPPMKWGRLRSYQLVLPPICIIFFTFQFTAFGYGIGSAILIILAYVITHMCMQTAYTADFAMIQELAATPEDRVKLNSNRMVGSNLGRLICSYAVPTFVAAVQSIISENYAYMLLAFVWAVVLTIGYWIHFRIGRGYENQASGGQVVKDENLKLKDVIIAVTTNKYLVAILISDLSSNVGSFVIPALNVYYYNYVAATIPNAGLAMHLLLTSLAGLIGAWLAGVVGKRVRNKRRILIAAYTMVVVFLLISRAFALTNGYLFLVFQALMQMVVGFTQPFESDLYMDVAVYHEWKTGKNCTALILGLLNIPIKLSNVIKSLVITALLASVSYVAGMAATPQLINGIANAYVGAPLVAPIIGFVIMTFFFRLSYTQVAKMQQEINERRTAKNEQRIEDEFQQD